MLADNSESLAVTRVKAVVNRYLEEMGMGSMLPA
jgi:hypothetical protein